MIGFAVTYTWAKDKNVCNENCIISSTPICDNGPFPALIDRFRSKGGKVLLSFGGAGMGGSWEGDVNDCWKYCFGKEDYVVERLVELNEKLNMDGVDIDYEWFTEDTPDRGFTMGTEAMTFLRKVTTGLRQQLPDTALVTHAPMDVHMVPGNPYFELLAEIGDDNIDFLMPQYYNGNTRAMVDGFHRAIVGAMPAAEHYGTLVDQVFQGDATRVVFGFCIDSCSASGSNADSATAVSVMQEVNAAYPCNGGLFFWSIFDDVEGQWAQPLDSLLTFNRGCNDAAPTDNSKQVETEPTTMAPTKSPVSYPPVLPPYTPNTDRFPDFYDPNNVKSATTSIVATRYYAFSLPFAVVVSILFGL